MLPNDRQINLTRWPPQNALKSNFLTKKKKKKEKKKLKKYLKKIQYPPPLPIETALYAHDGFIDLSSGY